MHQNEYIKVVVDTNLWISFLISNRLKKLDSLLYIENIRFLFSEELLDELQRTILKPKLKKHFGVHALNEMLVALEPFIEIVKVKSLINECRDQKDNFLLALAKDGKANFLLTGDKDLLEIEKYGKTRILLITHFLEEMKNV